MHNKLRERYGLVKNLDFPGKRLVTALSSNFVDTRKVALEKYMQVGQLFWTFEIFVDDVNAEFDSHPGSLRK